MKRLIVLCCLVSVGCTAAPSVVPPTPTTALPSLVEPTASPAGTDEVEASPTPVPGSDLLRTDFTLGPPNEPIAETAFHVDALTPVRIEVSLQEGTLSAEITLLDRFNNTVLSLPLSAEQRIQTVDEVTLPFAGDYRLRTEAMTGSGRVLTAVDRLDARSGGGELPGPGTELSAMLPPGNVLHTVRFPLERGQVVGFEYSGAVVLFGPDGRITLRGESPIRDFAAPQTGDYLALISGAAGSYTFTLLDETTPPAPSGDPDFSLNQTLRARFAAGDPLRLTFDGSIGDVVRVALFDASEEGFSARVALVSPFDQIIAFGRDQLGEVQLPYSGRYRLDIVPETNADASFVVQTLGEEALTGGGRIAADDRLPGVLAGPGVFHAAQFSGEGGQTISLELETLSDATRMGFALLGPNGKQLAYAGQPEPALLDYPLEMTGTYTVIVYTLQPETVRYELSLSLGE